MSHTRDPPQLETLIPNNHPSQSMFLAMVPLISIIKTKQSQWVYFFLFFIFEWGGGESYVWASF